MMILAYYIEVCTNPVDPERCINSQRALEDLLVKHHFAFLESTEVDHYTRNGSNYRTLDDIEADIECK